ncbi:thiamine pyrophosphate-binding protein [Paraburkholderia kururiensis]|uniref:thiamine pyrophosphate-binding protein n=1 Tax=Paraburkholderia kururiensis TaxID=984307 RepID=UPI0005A9E277|nr:thiamine pyrophosphate-binding protein [Paraburkholderia kururiensis]
MKHVGDLLAKMLLDYGVEYVFGMPGGQTTALHDGISRLSPAIQHILVRDERSAPYAADAYARLTGKPGVCDVTVGPGATKLPDGLVEAYNASIPMIAIVGELPLDWVTLRHKGVASQGFDQQAFFHTITKATFTVPSVAALPDVVRSAFRIATSPRPGPVVIIVPHDVMDAPYPENLDVPVEARCVYAPSVRYRPPQEHLESAAALIARARRPTIIAGGGVHGSDASDALTSLTDLLQPLVVTSLSGKGAVPESRPYCAGVLNPLGSAAAIELIKEADLLIWCGSKASQNTAMNWTLPLAGQATITIDADPAEHGRTFEPTVALCGDIRLTIEDLHAALLDAGATVQADWLDFVSTRKEAHESRLLVESITDTLPLKPQRVMHEIRKRLTSADVVISDASWSAGWIAQYIPAEANGRQFLYARGQGGLGYSIPAAIGAGAVQRSRGGYVVTVAGDGGHSFSVGELATLAQNRLKVVNVVLNNGTLGWLQMWQELFFSGLRQSVDLSFGGKPDFSAAASAMGLLGLKVQEASELADAFDAAFSFDGPSVIEVLVDPRATPIHSFSRRLADTSGKVSARPGTVYELRQWRTAAHLHQPEETLA